MLQEQTRLTLHKIHFCIAAHIVTLDNIVNSSMWHLTRCSFMHFTKALILESSAMQHNAMQQSMQTHA